ncbi:DNA-binding response regulator [Streptomyces ruber]|uniref:DNA-binding response regulator n=2 Tax=Streptomyces TaxID=1883 RepID=A0A918EU66_9ACTN|nr:response regulator transcription factor [Streptomyces ruber]GGQ72322.1 DNA-binding response regulator [Streptomyces ruber]
MVIADHHTIYREALSGLLDGHDEVVVVGHAATPAEAVQAAATLNPDVVLLNLPVPDQQGPGTVRQILRVSPGTRVYVLTGDAAPAWTDELTAAGAGGCLHKEVDRGALVRLLAGTAADRAAPAIPLPPAEATARIIFSQREDQILNCVASAMSNRQIAAALGITEGSVKRHLHNVFQKLGAVSRLDAVNKAVAASLIPPPAGAVGNKTP